MRIFRIRAGLVSTLIIALVAWFCFVAVRALGGEPANRAGVVAGQKAPAFQAKTIDGGTVNFPDDYKGKIVLLDFWATWCGPCRAELPNVAAAFRRYHTNGFEVLSVSLDKSGRQQKVIEFVRTNNLTWPQIYQGGYMKSPIAVTYGIIAIPCPVVVDGDTGVILAEGRGAVGPRLGKLLQSALASKAKARK